MRFVLTFSLQHALTTKIVTMKTITDFLPLPLWGLRTILTTLLQETDFITETRLHIHNYTVWRNAKKPINQKRLYLDGICNKLMYQYTGFVHTGHISDIIRHSAFFITQFNIALPLHVVHCICWKTYRREKAVKKLPLASSKKLASWLCPTNSLCQETI